MTIPATNFRKTIHGFGAVARSREYTTVAFELCGKLWEVVRFNGIKNAGKNIWVYEDGDKVFAGVELLDAPDGPAHGLEEKVVHLHHYASQTHVGPYRLIGVAGEKLKSEIRQAGLEPSLPYIEIYGHWTSEESKLETELIFNLT